MKNTILIFEDNTSFAKSLQLLINTTADKHCPEVYPNPIHILEAIKKHNPAVLLMDIDMPKMNGIEAIKVVKKKYPNLPIIMQTIFDDGDKIYNSILAGANGYILKKATPSKYLDAIDDVINGGAPMTASVAAKVLNLMQNPPEKEKEKFDLTAREKTILESLVAGLSYKMIATEHNISYHTVNAHIRKIYNKLQVHNATEAVSSAIRNNLVSLTALLVLFNKDSQLFDIFTQCLE
jgi:DNA-binding NarL/FixJ family response regulator